MKLSGLKFDLTGTSIIAVTEATIEDLKQFEGIKEGQLITLGVTSTQACDTCSKQFPFAELVSIKRDGEDRTGDYCQTCIDKVHPIEDRAKAGEKVTIEEVYEASHGIAGYCRQGWIDKYLPIPEPIQVTDDRGRS